MHIEVWSIMILINLFTDMSRAEVHFKVEKNIIPMKECNLIEVSEIRIDAGTVKLMLPTVIVHDLKYNFLFRFWEGHNEV